MGSALIRSFVVNFVRGEVVRSEVKAFVMPLFMHFRAFVGRRRRRRRRRRKRKRRRRRKRKTITTRMMRRWG